ncbi:hypothetical protein BJ912DRAFT_1061106 [Pholiota molesta]|nr:hypothetical protein BJ912DRAFT_1061106 [Pholiota molesta]
MLSRIPRVSYASRLLTRRYATKPSKASTKISTVTSPSSFWAQTFKKVTAYPFTVKPRDAQVLMETLRFISDRTLLLLLYKLGPQSLIRQLLFHYVRYKTRNDPIRVKAVYVPIWRIFTFVNFRPITKEGKLMEQTSVHLPDVTPFWEFPDIQSLETKPIGECIKPFEMDAQCLPFTISPFAPFDLAATIPDRPISLLTAKEEEPVMVFASTLSPEVFAAFPVMVPVYTAEYSVMMSGKRDTFNLPRIANLIRDITVQDDPEGDIKVIWWRTLSNHVKKLAKMPPLKNDDDPCIRPLNEEELDPVLRLFNVRLSMREFLTMVSGPFTCIRFPQ